MKMMKKKKQEPLNDPGGTVKTSVRFGMVWNAAFPASNNRTRAHTHTHTDRSIYGLRDGLLNRDRLTTLAISEQILNDRPLDS